MTEAIETVQLDASIEEQINLKVQEIISEGRTYDYLMDAWQRHHYGDTVVGKILILSVGCGSILNAKGFHVQVSIQLLNS